MGNVNFLAEAKREEDPSTNQRDGNESSRTLIEDQGDKEESKTLTKDQRNAEETKTLTEDLKETEEEDEDLKECGWCTYIKGGECKDAFIALERCVDEAEKNEEESDVTKCKEARVMFKTCMCDNPVYYEPMLAGEARVIAKMLSDLYEEKEAIIAGEIEVITKAVSKLKTEEAEPILPAEAAAIGKAFNELEAEKKKKKKDAEGSKSKESDRQNQN